ncbi:MAG: type II CAAX prenyl endopeptidase Rce1 family protein [Chloroflexota bacterium]
MSLNWTHFIILVVMGVMGSIAVLPYAFTINRERMTELPMPLPRLIALSIVQSIVMISIVVGLGLLAADANGLPIGSAPSALPLAVASGVAVTLVILLLDIRVFQPHMPPELRQMNKKLALWKRSLACLYGGITEELLMRLFLMNVIAWVLLGLGLGTSTAFWAALLLAALVFGAGHLPAAASMTTLTRVVIARILLLNALGGIVFGWLFWQHGLVAAMAAHFAADVVLHIITPVVLPSGEPAAQPA